MKKQLFLIFILFFLLQHGILAGKIKLIKQEACIGIELEKIKNVDFASEDAIYELVKEILPEKLKKWKKTNLKRAAIIFIKHQFNEENLKLKDAFKVRDTKILRLDESIKTLEKELEALEALDMEKQEIFRRRELKNEINTLKRERFRLKYRFFEKENDFHSYVLHKEKKEWSSYLFGTGRFLIVLLGGQLDMTTPGIRVIKKDSALEKSFAKNLEKSLSNLNNISNLYNRITGKGSYEIEEEVTDEPVLKAADNKFICRFVELNPQSVRPPCTISIRANQDRDNREVFDFDVIEKNVLQFKIGLAASVLQKLKYTFEDNNFKVEIDEDDGTRIRKNLFLMLDIHLPRDMDEFRPCFFKPWKNFLKRWGLFLGLKLSSDPFKVIFTGVSFALSKDINLVGGISFYDEVQPSSVEINWYDLDYAMKLIDRKYKTKLSWGFSFSPTLIPRLLGINL
jgi:hypothetical protein